MNNNLLWHCTLQLIEANDLVIYQDQWKFFQLLSKLLYQTIEFESQIQDLCRQYLKLNYRELQFQQIQEYLLNPEAQQFQSLNLELISLIFKVKVELYQVDDGLMCTIFNHRHKRTIRLFKSESDYYELQTLQYKKKFKFVHKMVYQLVNDILHVSPSKPIKKAQSIELSQHVHPTLDLIYTMNDLGVRSAQKYQTKERSPMKTLTPQYKIVNSQLERIKEYSRGNTNTNTNSNSKNISYGPVTPIGPTLKKRAFDYSEASQKIFTEQIKITEEMDETQFLSDIMKQGQQPPSSQSSQQILASQPQRVFGRLKFFHEAKQYGFFVDEKDEEKNIFVHLDDMQKSGIDSSIYQKLKQKYMIYFSFQVILYQGKSKQNVKAIEIKLERIDPPPRK